MPKFEVQRHGLSLRNLFSLMGLREIFFILCLFSLCGGIGIASDTIREAAFADEIVISQFAGKKVWLEAGGIKFLGLYTDTPDKVSKGAVMLLHDQGWHPNQPKLIKNLRTYLPEHGWPTLSLQMPLREYGAHENAYFDLFPEALARIEAGIQFLKEKKARPIIVAGYGLGGLMAVYAQNAKGPFFDAIAAISLAVPDSQHKSAQTLEFIKNIKTPLLDIYAERDLPEVGETDRARRVSGKQNSAYRQVKINGENHAYQHDEGLVVKRVYSWIESTANQQREQVKASNDPDPKNQSKP